MKIQKYKFVQLQQTGSSNKEHKKKCARIAKILHLVAKDTTFVGSMYSGKTDNYIDYPADFLKYIDKLAQSLAPDVWVRVNKTVFDKSQLIIEPPGLYYKPTGIYMSKGDWIFSQVNNMLDVFIDLIKVDYTGIKIITSIKDATKFTKKYGYYRDNGPEPSINWIDVEKDYPGGIAIVPNICTYEVLRNWNERLLMWMCGWDVSTLVIWNPDNIVAYKTALNTADYISEDDFFGDPSAKLENMIDAIIISSKNMQ